MTKKPDKPKPNASLSIYISSEKAAQIKRWQRAARCPLNPRPRPGHIVEALVDHGLATGFLAPATNGESAKG